MFIRVYERFRKNTWVVTRKISLKWYVYVLIKVRVRIRLIRVRIKSPMVRVRIVWGTYYLYNRLHYSNLGEVFGSKRKLDRRDVGEQSIYDLDRCKNLT